MSASPTATPQVKWDCAQGALASAPWRCPRVPGGRNSVTYFDLGDSVRSLWSQHIYFIAVIGIRKFDYVPSKKGIHPSQISKIIVCKAPFLSCFGCAQVPQMQQLPNGFIVYRASFTSFSSSETCPINHVLLLSTSWAVFTSMASVPHGYFPKVPVPCARIGPYWSILVHIYI